MPETYTSRQLRERLDRLPRLRLAALRALRADEVDAHRERLVDVLRVADHVHHGDAAAVQALYDPPGIFD